MDRNETFWDDTVYALTVMGDTTYVRADDETDALTLAGLTADQLDYPAERTRRYEASALTDEIVEP